MDWDHMVVELRKAFEAGCFIQAQFDGTMPEETVEGWFQDWLRETGQR